MPQIFHRIGIIKSQEKKCTLLSAKFKCDNTLAMKCFHVNISNHTCKIFTFHFMTAKITKCINLSNYLRAEYRRFLLIQYPYCQRINIGLTEYWIKHRTNISAFQTKKIRYLNSIHVFLLLWSRQVCQQMC
jgi:hypothetical protein